VDLYSSLIQNCGVPGGGQVPQLVVIDRDGRGGEEGRGGREERAGGRRAGGKGVERESA
jgi:hypothetical protein